MAAASSTSTAGADLAPLLSAVASRAVAAGVFGSVEVEGARLSAAAKAPAAPAWYRLLAEGGRLWVSLVTPDRWLSHSVEADLLNTGDKIEELIQEELAEFGVEASSVACEHFRDEEKLFTFRTPLPVSTGAPGAADAASRWLLAYEACFRRLGDMEVAGEGA